VAYGKVYIGGEYAVYAFDELTGALLYKYPIPGAYLDDSPAVANGLVYIATSGGGPSGGNAIYALNANNLTKRWVNHTPENTIMESSPAVANGVVYITSDRANNPAKGFLYAWNAATGTPLWSFQLPGGGTASSPAVVDGVVYFGQWWDGVLAVGTQHPIFVTVPNGGQKWKQGSTQTIRWLYSGSPGSKVKIELLKGTTVNRVINASTAIGSKGSGSYSWKILSNQIVGTNYKIRIKSTSNPALTDTSNEVFTISA
jgi:outer membrane protein assembly factor BamB